MKKEDCQHVYYGQWILADGEFKHYYICAKCGNKKESEVKINVT